MKKLLLVVISLLFSFNLVACSKGYDEIPEKYINYVYRGEGENFFEEYSSEIFKQLYIGLTESDFENFIIENTESVKNNVENNKKYGRTFEYKSFEVYKEFSKDEVKQYNDINEARGFKGEKFSELLQLTIYYDQYKDGQLEKEHHKGMLIGKYKGEWLLIRFFG